MLPWSLILPMLAKVVEHEDAAAAQRDRDGTAAEVRLAAIGIGSTPLRLAATEACVTGRTCSPDVLAAARAAVEDDVEPVLAGFDDPQTAYRRELLGVLVGRALEEVMA